MNRIGTGSASLAGTLAISAATCLGIVLAGCGGDKPAPKKAAPPLPVTVVEVEKRDIPDRRRFPGTTQAVTQVSLVARVEGFLEDRLFEEGSVVNEGHVLFVIEQPPYEAEVLKAAGAVLEAEAALELARIDYERNLPLAETGAVSTQELDQYAADFASARGRLEAAEAARIEAEIRLEYTEVRAPFTGRIGERLVDVGNVVGGVGNPTALANLVQVDPMRVVFEPPGSDIVAFLAAWPSSDVSVEITLPGENGDKAIAGRLDLVDNVANQSTSTFLARASFPNADGRVLPGLAADLVVDLGMMADQMVVPAEAIRNDPQNAYVWVEKGGVLARTDVVLGPQWQGVRVVTGLEAGDHVLVTGNPLALRTGMKVAATDTTIDAFLAKTAKDAEAKVKSADPASSHPAQSPAAKSTIHDSDAATRHSGGGGS
ncbi:MAG: efflux RND transporter periplasmic adaptor subunit [Phycisphaera sp.]|nr:efflux RND transporter periplasmic adaptor subunit [Phycisphaera sp.]